MMKLLSLVVNLDTRPGWLESESIEGQGMIRPGDAGTRSLDYLLSGVENKRRFFHDMPVEVILYIDTHEPLPAQVLEILHDWQHQGKIDVLCFAKHRRYWKEQDFFGRWQDLNYLDAFQLARGTHVAHFDADVAAFSRNRSVVDTWIDKLDQGEWSFICYPTKHSPDAVHDPSFDYRWASTRFFLSKREAVEDVTEIRRCHEDMHHLYAKYGDRQRKCPWMEHILGLIHAPENGGAGVWYPPFSRDYLVFSWSRYVKGLYDRLNSMHFDEVLDQVQGPWGGVQYPCDVRGDHL